MWWCDDVMIKWPSIALIFLCWFPAEWTSGWAESVQVQHEEKDPCSRPHSANKHRAATTTEKRTPLFLLFCCLAASWLHWNYVSIVEHAVKWKQVTGNFRTCDPLLQESSVRGYVLLRSQVNYHSFNITQEHLQQAIQLTVVFTPPLNKVFPIMLLFR